MELKPGHKRTEFGVLPTDWDTGTISSAVEKLEAGASVNSEEDESPDFESYPRVLKTGAAKEGSFDPRESKKVARRDLWRLKVSLRKDTILISRMNTVELVGESGYVAADYPNLFVPDRMWMATVRSTGRVHPRWLSYILTWQPVKSQISASATGTSGSMKNVSKPSFRAVEIPYPPVEQQRAIAAALRDADALIESLEQVLAKKRHLKQATMQELLTGKTRLPGFSGKWDIKALKEICWFQEGPGVRNNQFTAAGVKLLNGTNIFRGVLNLDSTSRFISEREAYGAYAHFLARAGDIVIASSGIAIERFHEKVAFVREFDLPFCMNTSTIRFQPFTEVVASDFLYQFLISDAFKRTIGGQATGSAQLNFGPSHVAKVTIPFPSVREQTAIAAILSDMDAEIGALEAKLSKARQLKEAMMQELLTGRTRLI